MGCAVAEPGLSSGFLTAARACTQRLEPLCSQYVPAVVLFRFYTFRGYRQHLLRGLTSPSVSMTSGGAISEDT